MSPVHVLTANVSAAQPLTHLFMQVLTQTRQTQRALYRLALVPALIAAALATGCGDDKGKATQAAARVNDQEVTVHQINLVLERQQGLKPEQADAASRQILEGLIDQEVAVQKAEETKLDRDPKIVQLLDATRRGLLARSYYERASTAAVGAPAADEIKKYFEANPGLFADRRIYMLQEFTIQGDAAATKALQGQLEATTTAQQFAETLKASGLKFGVNQVTQPAESLPLAIVSRISALKDGQALYEQGNGGMKAVLVVASRPQPLTFDQSKPLIERFLTETKRAEWLKTHVKDLRAAAKVEYMGKFAEKAASGAASGAAPAAPAAPAASGIDQEAMNKGLSGLK
jgi:EpsD family peptidyl-prolyl cis-trans isomerase